MSPMTPLVYSTHSMSAMTPFVYSTLGLPTPVVTTLASWDSAVHMSSGLDLVCPPGHFIEP